MVKRGTHRMRRCGVGLMDCGQGEAVRVRKGSVVVFDRRLLHRGAITVPPPGSQSRALVTMIFGRSNNSHTNELEKAYATYQAELANVRAPTQAFLRACALGAPHCRAWHTAFKKYESCLKVQEAPSVQPVSGMETRLSLTPDESALAVVQRVLASCKSKYLLATMGSELEAWLKRSTLQ